MPIDADLIRRDIVAVCQRLYRRGFIAGTEGNVSALEAPDRLWITPAGHHKGLLQPADLLLIDLQGGVQQDGNRRACRAGALSGKAPRACATAGAGGVAALQAPWGPSPLPSPGGRGRRIDHEDGQSPAQ